MNNDMTSYTLILSIWQKLNQKPPHHLIRLRFKLLTASLQHLDSFLFQTFCCRFAAVFGMISCCLTRFQTIFSCHTNALTSDTRILWYTEEFMVDSMTPGPVTEKQAHNHQRSTIVLHGTVPIQTWMPKTSKLPKLLLLSRCSHLLMMIS